MPRKLRQLRADIRRAGWRIDRQKGSHETWKHPLLPNKSIVIAGSDGADAKPYQEQRVREALEALRQAQQQQGQQP